MSFLEIGGLFGSIASGYVTDKLVRKVGRHICILNSKYWIWRPSGLMVRVLDSGSNGPGNLTHPPGEIAIL